MNGDILSFNKNSVDFEPDGNEPVHDSIFKQYERVIVESIITSFGLDMLLVKDQHGGDVDTTHSVRQIGKDPKMTYKNKKNEMDYENRGAYNSREYHTHKNYREKVSQSRQKSFETNTPVKDDYTSKDIFHNAPNRQPGEKAELDHVMAAKSVHDDRGRVLAEMSGSDLANSPENLRFTNKSLNASMGAAEIPDYIEKHPELDEETKNNMMKHYNKAKKAYDARIDREYYTSKKFAMDTGKAAINLGASMGLRQALGFVFTEVWFSVKEELDKLDKGFAVEELFVKIGEGIKIGAENAKLKYKEVFIKFKDGALAGILSSLTTTLSNIFKTTAKN